MGIKIRFDPMKAVEVLLYITSQVPDTYKALKILYFADKEHLARYGRLICGESYLAMSRGPVPSGSYDLVKCARGDGICRPDLIRITQKAFSIEGYDIKPLRAANKELLSESDTECLDWAIREYGKMTFNVLKDISHREPAYKKADENELIPLEAIVESLPNSKVLMEYLQAC